MESFAMNFTGMLLALTAVILVAWMALRLLRDRLQPGTRNGQATGDALRFVRALPVGPKERVVIVEHRGERWMLGVTAGGISTLGRWAGDGREMPAPASTDAGSSHVRR